MKRNLLFTAISVGRRLLVGLLLFLLLARLWGPAQFGVFSFAFSTMTLLVLVVDFGFDLYLMREVASHPEDAGRLVGDTFRAKLLLSAAATVAALCVIGLSGPELLPAGVALPLFVAALAMSFSDLFVAPLRALGHYDLETSVVTAGNALQFGLAGGVAWVGGTVPAVAVAILVSRVGYLLIARVVLTRVLSELRPFGGATSSPLKTIKRALPYGADYMLVVVWNQLDILAVRMMFGVQAAGLYAAGQKIVLGVSALAPVVGNVMIPRLSTMFAARDKRLWQTASKTSVLITAMGVICALPLIFWPELTTRVLFGLRYTELSAFLPWFGAVLLVRFAAASAGVLITAIGQQAMRVWAQLIGMFCIAGLIVVWDAASSGLAWFLAAYLGGQLVVAIFYFVSLFRCRASFG